MKLIKENIAYQKSLIRGGTPPIDLIKSPDLGSGIFSLKKEEMLGSYASSIQNKTVVKFIPSSGKATRMFSFLFGQDIKQREVFLKNMEKLPFDLKASSVDEKSITQMLSKRGLNYLETPKALMPFHRYGSKILTPFEEHIEGFQNGFPDDRVSCHFTIDECYIPLFEKYLDFMNCRIPVTFSIQNKEKCTIVLNEYGKEVYDRNGNLLLNPGGHGILIENLNQIEADIILIQNIDNISRREYHQDQSEIKKALIGMLFALQEKIFAILNLLDQNVDELVLNNAKNVVEEDLGVMLQNFSNKNFDEKVQELKAILNRPTRICGVVPNDGQLGGCPFWVKDGQSRISPQLVEKGQVNQDDQGQQRLFNQSKYFNPVDMACGIKDYKGNKFDLEQYTNDARYFISQKIQEGKTVTILERMGLWNGGMEYWNTLFVALPRWTFSPVKSVLDLLNPMHQPKS